LFLLTSLKSDAVCYIHAEPTQLWGHYADRAKGIALGFDSAKLMNNWGERIDVHYADKRSKYKPPFGVTNEQIDRTMLVHIVKTKAKAWEYEQEVRYVIELESCIPMYGLYFTQVYTASLTEVIAGPRFGNFLYLKRFLNKKIAFSEVKLLKALEHPTEYKIMSEP
jgi:hypothetical protein